MRGVEISSLQFLPLGGGSINDTFQVLTANGQKYFLKLNSLRKFPGLFAKEKSGLEYLGMKKIIRVPIVISCNEIPEQQFLLLEWIEKGERNPGFWKNFGEGLAKLHQVKNDRFGFTEDNYMGALPQQNPFTHDWIGFFINSRLIPQIKLARDKKLLQANHLETFEKLYKTLPEIFNDEPPSLLHGDLWSGNFICDDRGAPVLIDPAVYYGHRSVDLGMTTLFGGFDREFYDAYNYHYPFPSNHPEQWQIANLYPLLIHLNLFGAGYLPQIENTIKKMT